MFNKQEGLQPRQIIANEDLIQMGVPQRDVYAHTHSKILITY